MKRDRQPVKRTAVPVLWGAKFDQDDVISGEEIGRVEKVRAYLNEIDDDVLFDNQYTFITELRERLEKYGDTTKISDAQYGWCKGIWEKQNGGRSTSRRKR